MVIVRIVGGLGNQMFQYAYAKALEERGYEVKINLNTFNTYTLHGGYWLDKYNISLSSASPQEIQNIIKHNFLKRLRRKFTNYSNPKVIEEEDLLFNEKFLIPPDNRYILGYFQNEKYFYNIKEKISKEFIFNCSLSNNSKKIEDKILSSITPISIHIRRGDYISNKETFEHHGICGLDYYKKAIEIMNKKYENINFFIFSDEPKWAKENLKLPNSIYIENDDKKIPHEDMYLMSLCKHNIIANSSYSWWGAWTNKNTNKTVIGPKRWFTNEKRNNSAINITPHKWERI